jgi:hypothetical protein
MKNYTTLLALSKDERNSDLLAASNKAIVLTDAKTELQKLTAKILVAMIAALECKAGDISKHAFSICKVDIREKMQDVYALVNVFQGVIDGTVAITEDEYDTMDSAKLALLAPFMPGGKHEAHVEAAVEAAKNGTAKQIRDLKGPKAPTKAEKEVEKLQKQLIEVGFIATDIASDAPLVTSTQALLRMKADFVKAAETEGKAGDDSLEQMSYVFGTMLLSVAGSLDRDAKDILDEIAAKLATRASVVDVATELVAA